MALKYIPFTDAVFEFIIMFDIKLTVEPGTGRPANCGGLTIDNGLIFLAVVAF